MATLFSSGRSNYNSNISISKGLFLNINHTHKNGDEEDCLGRPHGCSLHVRSYGCRKPKGRCPPWRLLPPQLPPPAASAPTPSGSIANMPVVGSLVGASLLSLLAFYLH
ncbi:hypothetical protein GBA52_021713 [Prunus armeniaca]|nr:hypothetical protein GBA52_021713 [Prunus armeniaca]